MKNKYLLISHFFLFLFSGYCFSCFELVQWARRQDHLLSRVALSLHSPTPSLPSTTQLLGMRPWWDLGYFTHICSGHEGNTTGCYTSHIFPLPPSFRLGLFMFFSSRSLPHQHGWRPRRSLMFCSWAAEEYGLVGSTEWTEQFTTILKGRAVAYLNVDMVFEGEF